MHMLNEGDLNSADVSWCNSICFFFQSCPLVVVCLCPRQILKEPIIPCFSLLWGICTTKVLLLVTTMDAVNVVFNLLVLMTHSCVFSSSIVCMHINSTERRRAKEHKGSLLALSLGLNIRNVTATVWASKSSRRPKFSPFFLHSTLSLKQREREVALAINQSVGLHRYSSLFSRFSHREVSDVLLSLMEPGCASPNNRYLFTGLVDIISRKPAMVVVSTLFILFLSHKKKSRADSSLPHVKADLLSRLLFFLFLHSNVSTTSIFQALKSNGHLRGGRQKSRFPIWAIHSFDYVIEHVNLPRRYRLFVSSPFGTVPFPHLLDKHFLGRCLFFARPARQFSWAWCHCPLPSHFQCVSIGIECLPFAPC